MAASPDKVFDKFCEKIPSDLRPPLFFHYTVPNAPGRQIKSTIEIVDIIGALNDFDMKILESKRKRLKFLFKEKGLSHDLVDRIALMPITLGLRPDEPFYQRQKELCNEFREQNPNKPGWICLAESIRKIYENFGVQWTEHELNSDYAITLETKRLINKEYQKAKNAAVPPEQPKLFE